MPSSVIRNFAYDRDSAALDVTFVTGRRYRYFLVPPYVAEEMGGAFSKGSYFNARIREHFPFTELEDEPASPVSPGKRKRGRS